MRAAYTSLALFGVALGWAAFQAGGVTPAWHLSLLLIALGGLVCWVSSRPQLASQDKALIAGAVLIPCYVAFQLIPLPLELLRILSPPRAAVTQALASVLSGVPSAPLSVMPSATWSHLLRVLAYLTVFLAVREIVRRKDRNCWAAAVPVLAVALVEACLGLLQYGAAGSREATGTYVDRNHFAFLLEVAAPFAFAWAAEKWTGGDPQTSRKIAAASLLTLGGVLVCAVAVSLSRTGILALGVALAIVAFGVLRGQRRSRWLLPAAVLLPLILFFALPTRLMNRLAEVAATPGAATSDRSALWRETARIARDFPVTGCGLGARPFVYFKYKNELSIWTTEYAHNDYLQLLAELGIPGALLLLAVAGAVALRTLRPGRQSPARIACAAAFAAIAIHSVTEFNLYIPSNALLLAWVAGIAVGLPMRRAPKPATPESNAA